MNVDEQTSRILLVEDIPGAIDLVRTGLEGKRRRVFVAASGDDVADKAKRIRPDLILIDIVMPGSNGFDLCRLLKSQAETSDIPVIFISSRTETIHKVHGFNMGGADYITNPLDMAELLSRVEAHLKIGRLQQELPRLNTKLEKRVLAFTRALNKVNLDLKREIEARKHAEEALREKSAELFAIYENTPLAMILVDEDHRILKANRAAAGTAMLPLEEITGLSVGAAIKCINAREEPEECGLGKHCLDCGVRGAILDAFETGAPNHREEALLRTDRGDGPTDRFVRVHTAKLKIDGRAPALVCIEDVTERKASEEALRREKNKFQVLVEESPLGICMIGEDGRYTYSSPKFTEMFGYTLKDIPTGREWFINAYPDPPIRRRMISEWVFGMQEAKPGELEPCSSNVHCRDGSVKTINCRAVALEAGGLLVTYEDLTKHKRLESQLRQAQKMESLGALTGGIAHDLNNILMAILGNAEIMEMFDLPDDAKARSGLKEVISAANRAKDLVHQILSFSRQTEQERVELPLKPLVKETIKFIRASTPSTIEIRLNAEIENDAVYADPTRMHQVLMNLCANASQAMSGAGGLLEVTLEAFEIDEAATIHLPDLVPGDYVKLSVSDSGQGIAPGIIDHIFEPFFTTKKKGEGTGMGLSVVHGIVKSHGGAISVKSEPGKGSVFSVYYPAAVNLTETRTSSEFERLPKGRERILVVDDEQSILRMVEYTLQRLGYTIVIKTNGVEALEHFMSEPDQFDLVITDHCMPHVTGMELAKSIRHFEADIPIILCTGFSARVSEEQVHAAGIRKFLLKPLGVRDIAYAVREVLDQEAGDR